MLMVNFMEKVLDFVQSSGSSVDVDSSVALMSMVTARNSFTRLCQVARPMGVVLVFT